MKFILTIFIYLLVLTTSYCRAYHISIVNDRFLQNCNLPSSKSSNELNDQLVKKIPTLEYIPLKNMEWDTVLMEIGIYIMDLNSEEDTLIFSIFTHGEIDSIIDINDQSFGYSELYDVMKINIPKNFIIINEACYGTSCFKFFDSGIIFGSSGISYVSSDLGFFMTYYIDIWLEKSEKIDWLICFSFICNEITEFLKNWNLEQNICLMKIK